MAEASCPFCGVVSSEALVIQAHVEENHREGEVVLDVSSDKHTETRRSRNTGLDDSYVKCTRPGCGDYVLLSDIETHLDVHEALKATESDSDNTSATPSERRKVDSGPSTGPRRTEAKDKSRDDRRSQSTQSVLSYFAGRSQPASASVTSRRPREPRVHGRLGRRELGPHAWETQMPYEVRQRLLTGAIPRYINRLSKRGQLIRQAYVENETVGLIPLLAELCSNDRATQIAYLCNPGVKHITKIRCEGNFCGYWSIQVLLTYFQATGRLPFPSQHLQNVLQIQNAIEEAWDQGVCTYARTETGGIRGTRKWIGTCEAVAYLTQIGVPHRYHAFKDDDEKDRDGELASGKLLGFVEAYFERGRVNARQDGVSYVTQLPPLYFQRRGHSMDIVGLERKRDGSRNLLVFDSSFETSSGMQNLLSGRRVRADPNMLLMAYRRSDEYLMKWEEFEVITVDVDPANRLEAVS